MGAEEYRRLAEELRRAGTEVELDTERVRRRFADQVAADRAGTRRGRHGRRGATGPWLPAGNGSRLPVLSLSMVGAAVLILIVSVLVAQSGPSSVEVVDGGVANSPGPTATATASPPDAGPSRTSEAPNPSRTSEGIDGPITVTPSLVDDITVTSTSPNSRVNLGSLKGTWLVAGLPGGQQVTGPGSVQGLGPVQVMGSGDRVDTGPYQVVWPHGSRTGGTSNTWLVVPRQVRGAPSGLRVPLRLKKVPATITVYTGTVGGAGRLRVTVQESGGDVTPQVVELPGCTQAACPAVVRIPLGPDIQMSGSLDVVLEIEATGRDASVGLSVVQLN
jgi:hypothetical protein